MSACPTPHSDCEIIGWCRNKTDPTAMAQRVQHPIIGEEGPKQNGGPNQVGASKRHTM